MIVGSRALTFIYPDFFFEREIKDIDYICTYDNFKSMVDYHRATENLLAVYPTSGNSFVVFLKKEMNGRPLIEEYSIALPGSSNEMILEYKKSNLACINVLLMLKMSHRYKKNCPHFLKTMKDIHFLRSKGANLDDPKLLEILKVREKETYNYSHPRLNQAKETFFEKNDSFYVWNHDDIHKAVAVKEQPAYLSFKPENSEVMVSKSMWDKCDQETKLLAGLEESYVLAIERSLVPFPGVLTPKEAFDKALEKVCTSITSGWFREFCWEHYFQIQNLYDESFVNKFNKALDLNQIRKFERPI